MLLRSNNRRIRSNLTAIAAHVTTFATNVGGLTTAEQTRLNDLYSDLVGAGIWNKLWVLNVFLNDMEKSKFNFKDFATYKLTYPNGMSVDSLGVFGNGTNQYYKTNFIPSIAASSNQDSFGVHVFHKMLGVPASGTTDTIGVSNSNGSFNTRLQSSSIVEGKTQNNGFVNSAMTVTGASIKTNTHAQISLQRIDANTVSLYQFGQKYVEVTASASAGLPNGFDLTGMCRGGSAPSSFTSEYHSHLVISSALSQTEVTVLNQSLMKYHIASGRLAKSDVFFGDSITHGMSVASYSAWPYKLATLSGSFCQNWGVGGERIGSAAGWAYAAGKSDWQLPVYNPAIHNRLFFAHATNDQVQSMSAVQYGTDLTLIINLAIARGWPAGKIVVIPSFCQKANAGGALRVQYVSQAQSICASLGARCVDVYTPWLSDANRDTAYYGSDGTHPLDPGHTALANLIYSIIGNN